MKAAEVAERTATLNVLIRANASRAVEAMEGMRRAFERLGEAMQTTGARLADLRFRAEGGRFYWQTITDQHGLTRRVRRRDFRGWRR